MSNKNCDHIGEFIYVLNLPFGRTVRMCNGCNQPITESQIMMLAQKEYAKIADEEETEKLR